MLQQSYALFLFFVVHHQVYQYLTRSGYTQYHIAEPAILCLIVVVRQVACLCVGAYGVQQYIGGLFLQVAGMYLHHLVEQAGCMKAQCRLGREFFIPFGYLFKCAVPAGGESKLQFVAVVALPWATQYGLQLGQVYMAYTLQLVGHLLLLVHQLLCIRQHLPFTATAHTEVLAKRRYTLGRRCYQPYGAALCPAFFILYYYGIYYISRYGIIYK